MRPYHCARVVDIRRHRHSSVKHSFGLLAPSLKVAPQCSASAGHRSCALEMASRGTTRPNHRQNITTNECQRNVLLAGISEKGPVRRNWPTKCHPKSSSNHQSLCDLVQTTYHSQGHSVRYGRTRDSGELKKGNNWYRRQLTRRGFNHGKLGVAHIRGGMELPESRLEVKDRLGFVG